MKEILFLIIGIFLLFGGFASCCCLMVGAKSEREYRNKCEIGFYYEN